MECSIGSMDIENILFDMTVYSVHCIIQKNLFFYCFLDIYFLLKYCQTPSDFHMNWSVNTYWGRTTSKIWPQELIIFAVTHEQTESPNLVFGDVRWLRALTVVHLLEIERLAQGHFDHTCQAHVPLFTFTSVLYCHTCWLNGTQWTMYPSCIYWADLLQTTHL